MVFRRHPGVLSRPLFAQGHPGRSRLSRRWQLDAGVTPIPNSGQPVSGTGAALAGIGWSGRLAAETGDLAPGAALASSGLLHLERPFGLHADLRAGPLSFQLL